MSFGEAVIIDLDQFVGRARPRWQELEAVLAELRRDPARRLNLAAAEELYRLYLQGSADLLRLRAAAPDAAVVCELESLVGEAYAFIYESRSGRLPFRFGRFLRRDFPRVFRGRGGAFRLALLCTLAGLLFGAALMVNFPDHKGDFIPFAHLQGDPSARVAAEEGGGLAAEGAAVSFAAALWVHNVRVSLLAAGLGVLGGVGTVLVLFANGVLLGAVGLDYLLAGEGLFLAGWLLPHGVPEIGAILIAGQAGLGLGQAVLGYGDRRGLAERLLGTRRDFLCLLGGSGLLLFWAALVEAFISPWHEPVLPYVLKISLGLAELLLLGLYLSRGGGQGDV